MKITANPLFNEKIGFNYWPVSGEPPRCSIEHNNKSYSFVFSNPPKVEVWNLTKHGEIDAIKEIYQLGTFIPTGVFR